MKNWTIGKRITVGFASVILIAVILGAFAYTRLVTIRSQSDHIAKVSIPASALMTQVRKNALSYNETLYRLIGSTDEEDKTRLEAEMEAVSAENTKHYEELSTLLKDEKGFELIEKIKTARAPYVVARNKVLALTEQLTNNAAAYALARKEIDPASDQYVAGIQLLLDYCADDVNSTSKSAQSSVQGSQFGIVAGLIAACVVSVGLAFVIIRGAGKVLNEVSSALGEGSNQVASATGQISSSSQSLAEGSSEQAASLEETSSSLEEMASMTKRNSENAQKANALAKQARTAADKGANDMQTMSAAMEAIKASSDDIAKIIKTIDEIAFQTNILALNAAVEAARAGEAGMGFAVVADEVRNLAQRSAQAAKETAAKIEGAIGKTGQGVEISQQVAATLNEIVTKARQVDELVAEVSSASREQTQGITQINTAVSQMDKVTQSTAASAEESAAAAEELNAQAETMKHAVSRLLELVGGTVTYNSTAPIARGKIIQSPSPVSAPIPAAKKSFASNGKKHSNGHSKPSPAPATAAAGRGSIPMEGDFTFF